MLKKGIDENINKYIGKRIQEIRKEKGLKQEYLAEKTGVKRPNISKSSIILSIKLKRRNRLFLFVVI